VSERLRRSLFQHARDAAAKLRTIADRLDEAADKQQLHKLTDIRMPQDTWTVDAIGGAATILERLDAEVK
jgi:hypothetical protein